MARKTAVRKKRKPPIEVTVVNIEPSSVYAIVDGFLTETVEFNEIDSLLSNVFEILKIRATVNVRYEDDGDDR